MNQNFKISRVYPIAPSFLSSLVRLSIDNCLFTPPSGLTPIDPCQGATLNVKSELEDGFELYTSTLTFLTTRAYAPVRGQCYLCELTDGTRMIVGCALPPFPVSTYEDKHGRPGDRTSKLREVTVVWKAPMPALEVV